MKTPPPTTSADYLEAMAMQAETAIPIMDCTNELPDFPTEINGKSCYILGKVTGLPYTEVLAKFAAAEATLQVQGYKVYNPLNYVDADAAWIDAMRTCIGIVIYCKAVYCLPCWEQSKGATIEHNLAEALGLELIYQL